MDQIALMGPPIIILALFVFGMISPGVGMISPGVDDRKYRKA